MGNEMPYLEGNLWCLRCCWGAKLKDLLRKQKELHPALRLLFLLSTLVHVCVWVVRLVGACVRRQYRGFSCVQCVSVCVWQLLWELLANVAVSLWVATQATNTVLFLSVSLSLWSVVFNYRSLFIFTIVFAGLPSYEHTLTCCFIYINAC